MKVVLADPPRREAYYDNSYPNIGILYLISYLRKYSQVPVETVYLEGDCTIQEHLELIAKHKPDIYGLSFAFWTKQLAYKTINAVKERFPDLLVVCGGPEPTANCESVFENCNVDACVLSEGEETFTELVATVARDGDISALHGLALRNPDGSISRTPKRDFISDLDDIPLPAWELVDLNNYNGMHINKATPQTHMLVSRGCPFDCNFCSNPVWKFNKPWVRMRSPENIASEVKVLYEKGAREIYMTSDEFNVSAKWALDVCTAIKALNYNDLYFQCNLRADKVNDELVDAFKSINLWMVHLGIESGNDKTLSGIGKHVTLEQIERTCTLLQSRGVEVFGFVMLFHAWEEQGELRWETPDDVKNTLLFCRSLLSRKLIQYMSWQVATPMPGSRLHKLAQQYCLIPDKDISGVWAHNLLLPGIGQKDVQKMLRLGMIMKNIYLVKNGNINFSHVDRIWRNMKVLLGRYVG